MANGDLFGTRLIMRKSLFILAVILITNCTGNEPIRPSFVIQNVQLFDGENVIPNATIIVENGIIEEINASENLIFVDQTVIDGTDKTLIPGLINSHIHASKQEHTRESVEAGVLTVLDLLNNDLDSIEALRSLGSSSSAHAYYYTAGSALTIPGGHGTQFGLAPTVSNASEVPNFINDRVKEGSDYIKLMIERGSDSNPRPTLDDEMIKQAIEKSRELNKLSIAHITRRSDAIKAAQLGINGFAHIWYRDSDGITDEEIKILKEADVFMIPTLIVWQKVFDRFGNINIQLVKDDLYKLHQAGIPILAGTDTPNAQVNYGSDFHTELKLLVEVGLSPLEALKTATSNPSISFILGPKGFIKEGGSADFILISGDPTTDINALDNIESIWKQGQQINQSNDQSQN